MEECYSNYSVLECELCDLQEGYLKPEIPPPHTHTPYGYIMLKTKQASPPIVIDNKIKSL